MEKQEVLKDDDKILIFADNREFQSDVVKELARKDCVVKPQQLEVGDFILSERVAIERKTTSDFLSSVFDQRIFDQLKNMKEHFEKPILLIEGTDLYSERNVHPNSIRGALSSIAIDLEVPVLWSQSQDDTASTLFWIAKREQIKEERKIAIRGGKQPSTLEEQQLWLIAGLPGIDRVRAERILDQFGTPEQVFTASKEELKEVEGIGDKIAEGIRKVLTKEVG
ncbi:MAG: ERCC4 domain-containing protein [Candidatus Aenigmatarchaeota archaeon]